MTGDIIFDMMDKNVSVPVGSTAAEFVSLLSTIVPTDDLNVTVEGPSSREHFGTISHSRIIVL